MIALTNKEIFQELKTIGINTRLDRILYFMQYRVYFALQCVNTKKQNSRLNAAIDHFFK